MTFVPGETEQGNRIIEGRIPRPMCCREDEWLREGEVEVDWMPVCLSMVLFLFGSEFFPPKMMIISRIMSYHTCVFHCDLGLVLYYSAPL